MKKNTILFAVLINIFFLSSCITTKDFIQRIVKTGTIVDSKTKSVLIAGVEDVRVNNFIKTYKKNYENDSLFVASYLNEFSDQLKNSDLYASFEIVTNNNWDVLSVGYSINNQKKIDSLFVNNNTSDYLLHFTDFEMTNRIETSFSGGFGPNSMGHQTSVEYCIVNAKVVVYDIKTKKQVLEFVSTGESSVFLFDFTKTFLKAKSRSIEHAINYLKTGKITYKL